jgi:hypothetical protein
MVMAKAVADTTTEWTFLNDARERISKIHRSYAAAEHIIEQGIQAGTLRHHFTHVVRKGEYTPQLQLRSKGSPIFLPGRIFATINYAENLIHYLDRTECGVRLANEDLNKLPGITVSTDNSVESPDKPKRGGRKLTQAMELLKEVYPPGGLPPESTSTEQILQEARILCERRREPVPAYETFRRARRELTGK